MKSNPFVPILRPQPRNQLILTLIKTPIPLNNSLLETPRQLFPIGEENRPKPIHFSRLKLPLEPTPVIQPQIYKTVIHFPSSLV